MKNYLRTVLCNYKDKMKKNRYLVQGGKAEDDGWTILLFLSVFYLLLLWFLVSCSLCFCFLFFLRHCSFPFVSVFSSLLVFFCVCVFCPCFCLFASLSTGLFWFSSSPLFFFSLPLVFFSSSPLFSSFLSPLSPLSWPFSGFYSQRMSCDRLQIMRRPCMDFNAGITIDDSFVDV